MDANEATTHKPEATTHEAEAEATTHEAETHLEILIIIIPLFSTSFCLQILHFAVHLLADLSIVNSLKANLIILGQFYHGLHFPLGMT